ncbi:DegV family protein [Ilumatobacter sp.]|uniref:DegV family protein n=1 Tax=Ilumatobacter sp. TaxID=1967498 RepID=UPI003C477E9E
MIGLVTDSNSQMPPGLAVRLGVEVVPLTVSIDGIEYREGIDLDADDFYTAWADGLTPDVDTSQPSPGAFVDAYQRLIDRGVSEILSVHIAEAMSGTLNSARLACDAVDVPIRLVDTGTASFGITCCAWAAADAIAAGADRETAALVAEHRAARLRTSFVVGVPGLIDRSGRAGGLDVQDRSIEGIPVLAMSGSDVEVLDTVIDVDAAVKTMVEDALAWKLHAGECRRIAIGTSDDSSRSLSAALTDTLAAQPSISEIIQYRIGPSIGAHTGPGTAGLFVF